MAEKKPVQQAVPTEAETDAHVDDLVNKALKALEEFCNITATGLYNLQAVIDPDKIAIGGGISKQPILLEYLQKSLDKIYQSINVPMPQVNIVRCKYDNDSNLIGALANYKKIYNC